jgi:AraC-like DNA-binding protein
MLTPLRHAILDYIDRLAGDAEGRFETPVKALSVSRVSQPVMPRHMIYRPTICIVVQGAKQIMVGDRVFGYREMQSLVVTFEVPALGQITEASKEAPYIGLNIDFDVAILREVMEAMEEPPRPAGEGAAGVFVQDFDGVLADCVLRLVKLTETPKAIPVLYPAIMREICYWLLTGPNGREVCKLALPGSHTRRMTDAINLLRDNFTAPVRIEQLAAAARMSPSSFHQHFKDMTAMTPLQYQKNLRLLEARRLMVADGASVASAAYQVGYESASQFSRECSRTFGTPPKRDVTEIKAMPFQAVA